MNRMVLIFAILTFSFSVTSLAQFRIKTQCDTFPSQCESCSRKPDAFIQDLVGTSARNIETIKLGKFSSTQTAAYEPDCGNFSSLVKKNNSSPPANAVEGQSDDAQSAASPAPAVHDTAELAKKLSNPVASLISFPFQSNFDLRMGTGSGWRYTLNIQPVIPISVSAKWNMISRTILPVIYQAGVSAAGQTETGLGDITQSLFFSPKQSKRFIWGAGPAFLIPTATNGFLGTRKFGIGPTVLILKQENAWTVGVLSNHIWSVAGSENRSSVSSTFLQPFLAYNTKDAWTYTVNTESSYDWVGNHWSVPIAFQISKLTKFGVHPISFGGGIRCWAATAPGGPRDCSMRVIVTPLFPR